MAGNGNPTPIGRSSSGPRTLPPTSTRRPASGTETGSCWFTPPGLEMIATFFACVRIGVIAVPVYAPSPMGLEAGLGKLKFIAHDCEATAALTTSGLLRGHQLAERRSSPIFSDAPMLLQSYIRWRRKVICGGRVGGCANSDQTIESSRPSESARGGLLTLLGSEDLEGVVGGAGDVGIRICPEATHIRLETRGTDIGGDEQDHGQMLAPSNRVGHERLRALAALNEKHAGDGSFAFVRRAEGLDQPTARRATPGGRPE